MGFRSFSHRYLVIVGVLGNVALLILGLLLYAFLDRSPKMALFALGGYLESRPERPLVSIGMRLKDEFSPELLKAKSAYRIPQFSGNAEASFQWQTYSQNGVPRNGVAGTFRQVNASRVVNVRTASELRRAIKQAQPGDLINLKPGVYRFDGRSIAVTRPGEVNKPIYIRADRLGDVNLKFNLLEGFHVRAPYWVFENLQISGDCARDSKCEHAFHVTGDGRSFVLRNSIAEDFNAPLKVNGAKTKHGVSYPDDGLIEFNIFRNTRPRDTGNPVTLLNINSVDDWVVRGNLISDFSKMGSNRISYGAFMKGNGSRGIFERNLIYCEQALPRDAGVRIGLSFGGGGTGQAYCRHEGCSAEHSFGVMRNNIILNCSADVGIYLNKSAGTQVHNNLIHNSLGIDVRFSESSAYIRNNIVSGRIKSRDGGAVYASGNWVEKGCFGASASSCKFDKIFSDPVAADLRLIDVSNPVWDSAESMQDLFDDFCGSSRVGEMVDLGPIEYSKGVACLKSQ